MEEIAFCNLMCRICLSVKQEDFECLLNEDTEDEDPEPKPSELGEMYQNLFDLPIAYNDFEPRNLCNFCALQTKLLHKLKCRALQSYNQFKKSLNENNEDYGSVSNFQMNKINATSCFFKAEASSTEVSLQEYEISSIKYDDSADDSEKNSKNSDGGDSKCFQLEKNNQAEEVKQEHDDDSGSDNNVIDDDEIENTDTIWEAEFLSDAFNESNSNSSDNYTLEIEKATKDDFSLSMSGTVSDELDDNYDIRSEIKTKVVQRKTVLNNISQCKQCLEIFDNKRQLQNHCKEKHSRKTFACPTCHRIVRSEEALQVHQNIHNGLPAYKCEECEKTFKQKIHYIYHKAHHRNERKAICSICKKAFISNGDLKIHMRSHFDERRYKCDICDRSFRVSTHMKNHRYTHFGKQFKCSYCSQMYVTPATLSTHIKTVHLNVMAYQCEFCQKKFKRKHHLLSHYKVHKTAGKNNNGTLTSPISNYSED